MSTPRKSLPILAAAVLALTALRAASAYADVMISESGLIVGTNHLDFSFQTPGAGTIEMVLSDLDWPTTFASLDLSATSPGTVYGSMAGPGDLTFNVTSAGTYTAHLAAQAQGALDVGAYSLQVSYITAVPLPATAWLFLGGLGLLGVALRHRPVLPLAASA